MAMAMLESGPKLDWTRDNQIFLCYKKWRSKIELIFRSALSTATPEEKTARDRNPVRDDVTRVIVWDRVT